MPSEKGIVEAALYSAGKPLDVEEIVERTKLPAERVSSLLRELRKRYRSGDGALEIAQIGKKWTMQIRSEYTTSARFFAPPEVSEDLVKTAALIAYHQPIRQCDLGDMIGEKVYEHVKTLVNLSLITARPEGRTLSLTTSRHFPEFFGLEVTARKDIKRLMGERAGIVEKNEPQKEEPLTVSMPQ